MLSNLKGFHLEPTNLCTLQCPSCSRTQFLNQFGTKRWTNHQLNLEHLKSFIDIDITGKHFLLCGNYGDPIYYKELFELVKWVKKGGANLELATNGSYKTAAWWEELTSLLDETDTITFGIDGMPGNFTSYRINADWESIKIGLDVAVKAKVKTVWQFIPFKFNTGSIDAARQLSIDMGIDTFLILKSNRFTAETEYLRPQDELLGEKHNNIVKFYKGDRNQEITPECTLSNNRHFISADGLYLPCCEVADYRFFYKSEFYKNKQKYDISKTTLSTVVSYMQDFYATLEESKHSYCVFTCPKLTKE